MIRLGAKVKTVGNLYLGKPIPAGTKGEAIGRKSGDYGTLYIVQIGDNDFLKLAPAEIMEDTNDAPITGHPSSQIRNQP